MALGLADGLGEALGDGLVEELGDALGDGLEVSELSADGEGSGLVDAEGAALDSDEGVDELSGVGSDVGTVPDLPDNDASGDGESVADADAEVDVLGVALESGALDEEGDGDASADGERDDEGAGDAVTEGEADADGDALLDTEGLGEGDVSTPFDGTHFSGSVVAVVIAPPSASSAADAEPARAKVPTITAVVTAAVTRTRLDSRDQRFPHMAWDGKHDFQPAPEGRTRVQGQPLHVCQAERRSAGE
jgi:hypothetical protein